MLYPMRTLAREVNPSGWSKIHQVLKEKLVARNLSRNSMSIITYFDRWMIHSAKGERKVGL